MSETGLTAAINDVRNGVRMAPLWWRIGLDNLAARYRRTLLGPFWMASGTIATGLALAAVFGGLMGGDFRTMLPFILTGVTVWNMISMVITDGSQTFLQASGDLQSRKLPLSFHVFLQMDRAMLSFAHQLVAFWFVAIVLRFVALPHWQLPFGLLLVFAIGFFLAFPLGMLSTRYRDVEKFIGIAMGALFMLTPVFWKRRTINPEFAWIVDYNPFTYLLEIVREPLQGNAADLRYWIVALIILAGSIGLAILSLALFRRRVVFWL